MVTSVIIPAAGTGKRFNAQIPKQFTLLNDVPIIVHTLKLFDSNPNIDAIILAVSDEQIERIKLLIAEYAIKKVKEIVIGGSERHFSVQAALETYSAKNSDIILVHDAVRPFATHTLIDSIIFVAGESGAVIPVVMPKDTIKQVSGDNTVSLTLNRSELRAAQTPQGFKRDLLMNAYIYAQNNNISTTDDASVVEAAGGTVHTITGEEHNIKITTQLDFILAGHIINNIL